MGVDVIVRRAMGVNVDVGLNKPVGGAIGVNVRVGGAAGGFWLGSISGVPPQPVTPASKTSMQNGIMLVEENRFMVSP